MLKQDLNTSYRSIVFILKLIFFGFRQEASIYNLNTMAKLSTFRYVCKRVIFPLFYFYYSQWEVDKGEMSLIVGVENDYAELLLLMFVNKS